MFLRATIEIWCSLLYSSVATDELQLHHCLCLFFDHYQMEVVSGLIRQLRLANLVLQKWATIFSVVIFSLSATYCKISTIPSITFLVYWSISDAKCWQWWRALGILCQSLQSVFIILRHILSSFISLSQTILGLPIAHLVLYYFRKMYFQSTHSILGIVLTISSTSSSLITDLQAVLLMALAISLILAGTLK